MKGGRPDQGKDLFKQNPDSIETVAIAVADLVTGLSWQSIDSIIIENFWTVWPKNASRLMLLSAPSDSQDENVGWSQKIQIPVTGGKIVMENTPSGVPAEMHYSPNAQSQKAGERQFLFVANEIDLGRKSTVVEFVNSTRIAIAGMHGLLVENGEEVALSLFGFPYTLDYSLDNILRRIRSVSVQDAARAFRIQSLINTSQPSKALAQIEELSTRQGTIYTDTLIDELKTELAEQNKRLRSKELS